MEWNDKTRLTTEEVYGDELKMIDDAFIYFDDDTCVEIRGNNIVYYKLVNPFNIDLPIHKYNQVIHFEGGPASIIYNNNGDIISEVYYKNGKLHREDGPAVTDTGEYTSNEYDNQNDYNYRTRREEYYINGKLHREDGPAFYSYYGEYDNGALHVVKWFINGKCHRLNSPASISYYADGKIKRQEYFLNGKLHRKDGPAYISYSSKGKVKKFYYLDGEKLSKFKYWKLSK